LFDLDYTVWPFFLDIYSIGPPFRSIEDGYTVIDCANNLVRMLPDAGQILCAVADAGIPVVLCSRNQRPEWCKEVISLYRVPDGRFFSEICDPASVIKGAHSKLEHLRQIQRALDCPFEDLLFFDDEMRICYEARSLGVKAVCVTKAGLSLHALSMGLAEFNNHSTMDNVDISSLPLPKY
jgi:magnesium-dependent phosphatase-1